LTLALKQLLCRTVFNETAAVPRRDPNLLLITREVVGTIPAARRMVDARCQQLRKCGRR
jgi:hypothetical protein